MGFLVGVEEYDLTRLSVTEDPFCVGIIFLDKGIA